MTIKQQILKTNRVTGLPDWRSSGSWIFINYSPGWKGSTATHMDIANTWKEVLSLVRRAEPCDCALCVNPK